jgi:uncharacterized lipoprotein YajG
MDAKSDMAGSCGPSLSLLALVCVLVACTHEERISLSSPAPANVAPVAGADRVSLDVVTQDKRAQFADRVGTVRSNSKRIVSDGDVADLIRSAVEQGMKAQGFVLAAGGLIVTVELQNFYCDRSWSTSASVAFTLRARDNAGRTLYARYYESTGKEGATLAQGADDCRLAFERAIQSVVKQVIDDKALQTALLSAASKATRS